MTTKQNVSVQTWIRARTKGEGGNLSDENETDRAWSDSIETFPKSSVSPAVVVCSLVQLFQELFTKLF